MIHLKLGLIRLPYQTNLNTTKFDSASLVYNPTLEGALLRIGLNAMNPGNKKHHGCQEQGNIHWLREKDQKMLHFSFGILNEHPEMDLGFKYKREFITWIVQYPSHRRRNLY